MSLTPADVKKIAHLARLNLSDTEINLYTTQLSNILHFVDQMNQAETSHAAAILNPLQQSQRLRPDEVTEPDQRDAFQSIAPDVQAGLYIVPQVIEGE